MKDANKRKTRAMVAGVLVLATALIALFTVDITVAPPKDTRVILEHTHKTYISPPCFEQAEKTNNLEEATLQKALEMQYEPESSCTRESLKPVRHSLFLVLMEMLGLQKGKWNW